jgi:hypothetical protein
MSISVGGWMTSLGVMVRLDARVETAGDIAAIEAELLALREWLLERPEEPK